MIAETKFSQPVLNRDITQDEKFLYGVLTTGPTFGSHPE